MSDKFTIAPASGVHVVRAGGAVIGETVRALVLTEQGYEPAIYFPREDAGIEFLDPSETRTTCPHKGEATHFHIAAKSGPIKDAAWSYEDPLPGAEAIKGYIAFYPEKATVEAL
ncbi:MAG: DUF427 domain-containing protein [Xanthomonadales bacterium]|nr:DUF427 domain-containing protein [Xanthomonadales bacterium]